MYTVKEHQGVLNIFAADPIGKGERMAEFDLQAYRSKPSRNMMEARVRLWPKACKTPDDIQRVLRLIYFRLSTALQQTPKVLANAATRTEQSFATVIERSDRDKSAVRTVVVEIAVEADLNGENQVFIRNGVPWADLNDEVILRERLTPRRKGTRSTRAPGLF